jgi:CDP-glycerol glycerophosphotransferase
VLATGLPGTDLLVGGDVVQRRELTRIRLGIRPDQTAVLHARHLVDHATGGRRPVAPLDPVELCDLLGDDHVVLLRTVGPRAEIEHPRLLDVSDHPSAADLMLASDAAVVDHAALRFDYPLTGRPMVFHVPDPAVRAGDTGFLYPYAETTPGPVTTTAAQVADHLHDLERLARRQGQAMARFNARFNDHCDGRAAARVVAAVFGTGYGRLTLAPRLPADDDTRPRMRVVRGRS